METKKKLNNQQELIQQGWLTWAKQTALKVIALGIVISFAPLSRGITTILTTVVPFCYIFITYIFRDQAFRMAHFEDLKNISSKTTQKNFKYHLKTDQSLLTQRGLYRLRGLVAVAVLLLLSLVMTAFATGVQSALYGN